MRVTKKITISLLSFILISIFTYLIVNSKNSDYHDDVLISSVSPLPSTLKSNKYTQKDNEEVVLSNPYTTSKEDLESNDEDNEYTYLGQKNNLKMYVNKRFLSLRIINLETGFVWSSNMDHDYLFESSPIYNENDLGAGLFQDDYDLSKDRFIRQERSPLVITYYDTNKSSIQRDTEYFFHSTIAGTIQLNVLTDQNKPGFEATLTMPITKIKFKVIVYLDDLGLNVKVPFESIKEPERYKLATLRIYEYFGFTKRDTMPGYLLIPDGVGALIRFDGNIKERYSKRFYGDDFSNYELTFEQYLNASMYGIVQGINQNAMVVSIEDGAGNARMNFDPADSNSDFNRSYTSFEYRISYIQKLNKSGSSQIELIQDNKNDFDIHLLYRFIENDDANYVGMANNYLETLKNRGLTFTKNENSNISLHLDVLGSENKPGIIGRNTFKMTSVLELTEIVNKLKEEGINNIDVTYYGWNKGGKSFQAPYYKKIEPKIGKTKDISNLNNIENVDIYYEMIHQIAYDTAKGYKSSELIQTLGSEIVQRNKMFYLNPNKGLEKYQKDYHEVYKKYGIDKIALPSISNMLMSDPNQSLSRTKAINILRSNLDVANQNLTQKPFDYLWDSNVITDLSLYSSERYIFTDTVPFIPFVLSGFQKLYGRTSNFFSNTQNELLRMVDYNIYPSFYVTHESSILLLNSPSRNIFTSKFEDWENEIIRQYNYINDALKTVSGNRIIKRKYIDNGLYLNTYQNGVLIYINYSGNDYIHDGITISKMSYKVVV